MSSVLRALLCLLGGLLIVGATVVLLRNLGTVLPPSVSSTLLFVLGVAVVWVAFRPEPVSVAPRESAPAPESATVETSYDRAALARLQEAFDAEAQSSNRNLN